MPLVGTNFYGTQVQRTPWDDAEQYDAASRDATIRGLNDRLAQQQNRSDALQMHRDTLNYGVWQDQRNDARSLQAMEAQKQLAKMGFDFQSGMFDKTQAAEDARQRAGWDREDQRFTTQVKPFQDRQLAATDMQLAAAKRADEREAKRLQDQEQLKQYLATPEGQAAIKSGNMAEVLKYGDPLLAVQTLLANQQRNQGAEDAKVERVAQQAAKLRQQGQAAEAAALEATVPEYRRGELPGADPTMEARGLSEVTEPRGRRLLANSVEAVKNLMKGTDVQQGVGRWLSPGGAIPGIIGLAQGREGADEAASRLHGAVRREAQVLASKLNVDPIEAEHMLMNEMRASARTGFWNWFKGTSQGNVLDALDEETQ